MQTGIWFFMCVQNRIGQVILQNRIVLGFPSVRRSETAWFVIKSADE